MYRGNLAFDRPARLAAPSLSRSDRPLHYRIAAPLILMASLCLWAIVWQAGAYTAALLFG